MVKVQPMYWFKEKETITIKKKVEIMSQLDKQTVIWNHLQLLFQVSESKYMENIISNLCL